MLNHRDTSDSNHRVTIHQESGMDQVPEVRSRFHPGFPFLKSSEEKIRRRLVVVGNGVVGFHFLKRLVSCQLHHQFQITVLGEEDKPAYDRVRLTEFWSGRSIGALTLAPRAWYSEQGIELITDTQVLDIYPDSKTLRTQFNDVFKYDELVLATGSRALLPDVPGRDLPGVFVYRSWRDLEAIRNKVAEVESCAIIGGGLLGLEVARAFQDQNLVTHVIEHGTGLLTRQLEPKAASLLADLVGRTGIHILLEHELASIEEEDRGLCLRFVGRNNPLKVGMVVFAAGIRPRDELARRAGLVMGNRGGVVVNHQLSTSQPAIYAIGECTSFEGVLHGTVEPGLLMADVLAKRFAGKRVRYQPPVGDIRLKLPGIKVHVIGAFQGEGSFHTYSTEDHYQRLVIHRGRLVGATLVGDDPAEHRVLDAVHRRQWIWQWQKTRFLRTGCLWPRRSLGAGVTEWPHGATVCHCRKVIKGDIVTFLRGNQGCSFQLVSEKTGAATVCGSCEPLVRELLGQDRVWKPNRTLQALGWVAGACALGLIVFWSPLREWKMPDSVQNPPFWTQLWKDDFWRQVTGYSTLGMSVFSGLLSLKKRIPRLKWGRYDRWRLVHGVLGMGTLIGFIVHTGLRMGYGLNQALMLNFWLVIFLGAGVGMATALENQYPLLTPLREMRRLTAWLHWVALIPIPVFLFFHILKFYRY